MYSVSAAVLYSISAMFFWQLPIFHFVYFQASETVSSESALRKLFESMTAAVIMHSREVKCCTNNKYVLTLDYS